MMSLTFGLFTQVSGSGPLGPLVMEFCPFVYFLMHITSINVKPFEIFLKLGTNIKHHQTLCRDEVPSLNLSEGLQDVFI